MQEIDEKIIIEADSMCSLLGDKNNSFGRLIKMAQDLKDIGLTPMYIFDSENLVIEIKIKETHEKKLN